MKNKIVLLIIIIVVLFFGYLIYKENTNENLKENNAIEITEFIVPEKIYLLVGEEIEVNVNIKEKNNKKVDISYISTDDKIMIVHNNKIKGIKDGKVELKIKLENGETKKTNIIVTSLITKPTINNEKEYITCNQYTKEESDLLEELLDNKIKEGGYQTRAGALNAARFLLLEFKSGIKYFNENGRLENHTKIKHIDGEGRYYHLGLYLTEDKYTEIEASTKDGPKIWGCELLNIHYNKKMENGLNCSGFITWALYNAGYDIKDVGAGDFNYIHNELLDIEPKETINKELLDSNKIKVGDLIGFDGHIAMIIGLDSNNIYIGESYETGLRVRTYTKEELLQSEFKIIILMDEYYKNEGKITNMW